MSKLNKISLKKFIRNIYRLSAYDIESHRKDIEVLDEKITELENQLKGHTVALKYLVDTISAGKDIHTDELKYIIENGFTNFPYKQIRKCQDIISGFDDTKQLPFVEHKAKRLYFPHGFSVELASSIYKNFIERECILGGNYTEKTPHQYQTEDFKIEQGDVLVDVGCAEALLALDSIDTVSHAYLIEGDPLWIPAIEATFAPYADKVTIINKYIGLGKNDVSLQDIIEKHDCGVFIKMDIEGAEINVLSENRDCFLSCHDLKIVCCTYHKQEDYNRIVEEFNALGYHFITSEGYMLFDLLDETQYPYFRRGIIRASNSK